MIEKFKFHRLDFSSFGGQSDATILVEKKQTSNSKPKLVQRYSLPTSNILVCQTLESNLDNLKRLRTEMFTDYFKRHNGVYYLCAEFKGQGTRDLYMLANIKGAFSEAEVGSIALQILE